MNRKESKNKKGHLLDLILIEDNKEMAESLYEHIGLQDSTIAHYFVDCSILDSALFYSPKRKAYIVDINLGLGKHKEGLNIIKEIRKVDPVSLIVVYSAYPHYKKESFQHGADIFLLKDPESYEDDIMCFRNLIKREIQIP